MSGLHQQSCEACRGDSVPLTKSEIEKQKCSIPSWDVSCVDGIDRLVGVFVFKNFQEAINFTMKVGELSEEQNHHPALLTEWGKVTVSWWTHKIKGLHINDFIMAAKTDNLI